MVGRHRMSRARIIMGLGALAGVLGLLTPASAVASLYAGPAAQPTEWDVCPRTPGKAVPLLMGCSALEIALNPDLFYRPALEELTRVGEVLEANPELAPARDLLGQGSDLLALAGRRLGIGPCTSSSEAAGALARLGEARGSVRSVIEQAEAELAASRQPRGTDVGQAELEIATLYLVDALVGEAIGSAMGAAEASDAVCQAVDGKKKLHGIVKKTHDADGWFVLGKRVIGMAAKRFQPAISEGLEVRAKGIRFDDGTNLARRAKDLPPKGPRPEAPENGKKKKGECLRLRIAPVQPMHPYFPGPYTLHPTGGYEANDGKLHLEYLMRLGVEQQPDSVVCPRSHGPNPVHYWMQIDVQQGGSTETMASDLRDGDPPVQLPHWVNANSPVKIMTTVFRMICNMQTCSQPKKLAEATYTAFERDYGSYVSATYNRTEFSVTDDGVSGDFEAGMVTGVQLQSVIFLGTSFNPTAYFKARGWRIENGVSSRPQEKTILHSQLFAVYEDDFCDPQAPITCRVQVTGQERPSAIRWAHIEGTRGGKPFWYATALPDLVRDLINECPESPAFTLPVGDPDPTPDPNYGPTYPPKAPYNVQAVRNTYYKLPFQQGFQPGTGLMNIDDPSHPDRHPEWQAYAFDLTALEGEPLLAARGGRVILLEESDPWNWNDPNMPQNWLGIGNYMWIFHDDGSFGVYFHMQVNSVIPGVADVVSRGDHIAGVGDTGNASGPHVHFGTAPLSDPFSDGLRIRIEALRPQPTGGPLLDPCYIPRDGETFYSTNG